MRSWVRRPCSTSPGSAGQILGVAGADAVGDPARWGLDVLFPAFYLSLILPELRGRARPLVVAGLASVIALALTPATPAGVPVVVASFAALLGLRASRGTPMSTWLLILALGLGTIAAKVTGPLDGRGPTAP